eukprot:TRINITY_DN1302_c0_g3_i1.p1 TRINITY_DN1302_c0_g3~~TRINITY_DN1302_c0_g3_i1.p1  ORF type:complete len:410 (+),score=76.15 TRINITY_DN1302_c0_g3_i1:93-1322(+)
MVNYNALNVKYVREKNLAHILNEMLLHLLRAHPDDPLPALLAFLQSVDGQGRVRCKARSQYRPMASSKPQKAAAAQPLPQQQQQRSDVLSGGLLASGSVLHEGIMAPVGTATRISGGRPCVAPKGRSGFRALHGGQLGDGSVLHEGVMPELPGRGLAALSAAATARHTRVQLVLAAGGRKAFGGPIEPGQGLDTLMACATELIAAGVSKMCGVRALYAGSTRADPAECNDPALGRGLLCGGILGGGGFLNEGILGASPEFGAALAHLLAAATEEHWRAALLGQGSATKLGFKPYIPQDPLLSIGFGGVLSDNTFLNEGVQILPKREPGTGLSALLSVAPAESRHLKSLCAGDGLETLFDAASRGMLQASKGLAALKRGSKVIARELLSPMAFASAPGSMLRTVLFANSY